MDNKLFIEKSISIYGDEYDYSLVDYINGHSKVKIICKIHGVFEIEPFRFFSGRNCSKCKK